MAINENYSQEDFDLYYNSCLNDINDDDVVFDYREGLLDLDDYINEIYNGILVEEGNEELARDVSESIRAYISDDFYGDIDNDVPVEEQIVEDFEKTDAEDIFEAVNGIVSSVDDITINYSENDETEYLDINVEWGDWKHDHLYLDNIIEGLPDGWCKIDETVTDSDGSDTYSAIHRYARLVEDEYNEGLEILPDKNPEGTPIGTANLGEALLPNGALDTETFDKALHNDKLESDLSNREFSDNLFGIIYRELDRMKSPETERFGDGYYEYAQVYELLDDEGKKAATDFVVAHLFVPGSEGSEGREKAFVEEWWGQLDDIEEDKKVLRDCGISMHKLKELIGETLWRFDGTVASFEKAINAGYFYSLFEAPEQIVNLSDNLKQKYLVKESLTEASKLDVISSNKKAYQRLEKEIENTPDGLTKDIMKELGLRWCKGNNWAGGLPDRVFSKYAQKIVDKYGVSFDDVYEELLKFINNFTESLTESAIDDKYITRDGDGYEVEVDNKHFFSWDIPIDKLIKILKKQCGKDGVIVKQPKDDKPGEIRAITGGPDPVMSIFKFDNKTGLLSQGSPAGEFTRQTNESLTEATDDEVESWEEDLYEFFEDAFYDTYEDDTSTKTKKALLSDAKVTFPDIPEDFVNKLFRKWWKDAVQEAGERSSQQKKWAEDGHRWALSVLNNPQEWFSKLKEKAERKIGQKDYDYTGKEIKGIKDSKEILYKGVPIYQVTYEIPEAENQKRRELTYWYYPKIYNYMDGLEIGDRLTLKTAQEQVDDFLKSNGINESLTEDKNETLNPALWEGDELKPEVKETLMKIASKFISGLEEEGIYLDVDDIVIVGSNANYVYTDKSDIDLHIIFNSSNVEFTD